MQQEIKGHKHRERLLIFTNSCAQYGLGKDLFGELTTLFLEEVSNSYRSSE
ncbi:hypothetical protein JCM10512_2703 [Bacteroides reticulotermitis JCM 10512]|uniref:Uncharacterized protein n=1 Tax=Bacteroides reticulotermitis JCM 10512 TaxID=1445607 RepID=W4UV25_9BACE|nr:hypothetical protein JCM10512_2703 [Bacteroides reticulotermitis JCM 10512]